MKSKLITFIGAPSSGKSTLATDVHTELKKMGKNSIYIPEAATDWIAEYGLPDQPIDQLTIFYKQLNRERMFIGSKEYIICDSSGILNYFYFRGLFNEKLTNKNIATINHLQKEILKTLNQWDHIFYVPPMNVDPNDGVRYHNKNDIDRLARWIKTYLEIENIPFYDLEGFDISQRTQKVIETIK